MACTAGTDSVSTATAARCWSGTTTRAGSPTHKHVPEAEASGWLVAGDEVTGCGGGYYWFQGAQAGGAGSMSFAGHFMNAAGEVCGSWDATHAAQ